MPSTRSQRNSLPAATKATKDISSPPLKRGRKPAGAAKKIQSTACITLKINVSDLQNEKEKLLPFVGNYLHYPISKINSIDEVSFINF